MCEPTDDGLVDDLRHRVRAARVAYTDAVGRVGRPRAFDAALGGALEYFAETLGVGDDPRRMASRPVLVAVAHALLDPPGVAAPATAEPARAD
jgi:hypothetical protein